MSTHELIRLLVAAMVAVSVAGCDQSSKVRGKISDQPGTQQQGLSDTGGLGGSGTASAATAVQVMEVDSAGNLTMATSANVEASGSYVVEVPAGDRLIIQAVDAQGKVIASGVLEEAKPGQEQVAAPLDTETSVEASVLVQMIRRGSARSLANAVDLRARINTQVAAAVKASSDPDAKIQALADAIIAAQRTEEESYKQSGQTATQAELFQAEVQAAAHLDAALDRGDSAQAAYATFSAELDAARAQLGITAQQEAKAESCASSAYRATIEARLQASVGTDAVADAAIRQAAALEAGASAAAVEATLRAAGAADATVNAAAAAAVTLRASLSAATTAAASAQAYAAYQASIEGSTTMSGTVLGSYLGVNLATQLTADA
ncbi:MAG TPA: hypothetical protein VND93_33375, partial [Myxococcales bacterium]|nr:hypothetical protein [Myxococcales bacterium]